MNLFRSLWLTLALALLFVLVVLGVQFGWPASFLALIVAVLPDVALIRAFASHGRLKPDRVRFYNLAHAPALPLGLLAIAVFPFTLSGSWPLLVGTTAWLAHIAIDRAAGYGLREADGSIRPVGLRHEVTR